MNKKDDKKAKLIQEKCNTILNQLLRDEDNKYCCDCDQKGPRWASWNLGIFLCIRCAGIHRNLGVHISRVKSVNLDTWSPEQVVCLQQMGNSRARAVYEALLSDNFRRPQTDSGLENFIRAKYEQKKYIAREWIPPPFPPKVDWDKEIEEELENQKRKKKTGSSSSTTGISAAIGESTPTVKPPSAVAASNVIPAPLPKPHSPKNSRIEARKGATTTTTATSATSTNMDLLGLDTAPSSAAPIAAAAASAPNSMTQKSDSLSGDTFDFFSDHLSSAPSSLPPATISSSAQPKADVGANSNGATAAGNDHSSSLKREEEDFFNQKTLENGNSGAKLTNDKILALYGNATSSPQLPQFNANFQQLSHHTQQPLSLQDPFFYGSSGGGGAAAAPQHAGSASLFKAQIPLHHQQPQQPPSHQQFFPTMVTQPMQSQPSSLLFNGSSVNSTTTTTTNHNNNNFANFGIGFGTMQSQQINKLNEENIRKIESLNFNNFK